MAVEGHLHPYPPVGTDRLQSAESSQRADLRITAAVDPMLPMRCTCLPPMSVVVPLGTPPLASGTGNPVLCQRLRGFDVSTAGRRHARPALQDLGDGPTWNAKPAGRRGSRPRRREDRSPHAGWRTPPSPERSCSKLQTDRSGGNRSRGKVRCQRRAVANRAINKCEDCPIPAVRNSCPDRLGWVNAAIRHLGGGHHSRDQ
jgi:hypothetical protein